MVISDFINSNYKEVRPNSNDCKTPHNFEVLIFEKPRFEGDEVDEFNVCPQCQTKLHIMITKSGISKLTNISDAYWMKAEEAN